jgi:hypothetical protein
MELHNIPPADPISPAQRPILIAILPTILDDEYLALGRGEDGPVDTFVILGILDSVTARPVPAVFGYDDGVIALVGELFNGLLRELAAAFDDVGVAVASVDDSRDEAEDGCHVSGVLVLIRFLG